MTAVLQGYIDWLVFLLQPFGVLLWYTVTQPLLVTIVLMGVAACCVWSADD